MLENADRTKEAVIQWIKDFFRQNAPDASAVIGISGGKDFSVAAALCAEALGKECVVGVTMPDGQQPDIEDSYALIKHLGIQSIEINIHSIISAVKWEFSHSVEVCELCGQTKLSEQAKVNLLPRIRMMDLYEITMANGYFRDEGANDPVTFDVFYRKNPDGAGFAIFAGLEQVLDYLENLHFENKDIEYLRSLNIYNGDFLDWLAEYRFRGTVTAMPEGSIMYPNKPILTVCATD